jgi:glycogen debranching enzyme
VRKQRSNGALSSERVDALFRAPVSEAGQDFQIRSSAQLSRRATRVLVNGESFAVFEAGGDIVASPDEPLGFFHRDTRYLSCFELKIAGETPYYLNSDVSQENAQLRVNLSNPDLGAPDNENYLPHNSIQLERNCVIVGPALFHKLRVRSYTLTPVKVSIDLLFSADFADVFEVRGFKRPDSARRYETRVAESAVTFRYRGSDSITRFTKIEFDSPPALLQPRQASFVFVLQPEECRDLEVRIIAGTEDSGEATQLPIRFADALAQRRCEISRLDAGWARISTSHESFNLLLDRSAADLTSMIRFAREGTFLMAGIPWFATLFGRDSILTALFTLPFNPALAVGTLKCLASLQGSRIDQQREEQPGKIVHEIRDGELALTGQVPFGRYYGSVDSTPLFLWLLGRYVETTGDLGLAEELWSNAMRALDWIERWGDADGDLFVEYRCETSRGLVNQGWKDSFDAISHANGSLAQPPIALCEVQGYVYSAYGSIASVARRLGHDQLAARLNQRAAMLRARFSRDFWLEHERTVALALDGDKRPCRVMSSNAGHCLACGLLNHEQSELLADRLMDEDMFTGWGVRTLSSRERRYNPMSYHNGSVWPHDNALIAVGLARAKRRQDAIRILGGLVEAASHLNIESLPELFCGIHRDERLGPVPYPVACHPQAWSAASLFMILQAILGLEVKGFEHKLVIDSAEMPNWLEWVKIENLKVGEGRVSLILRRIPEGASVAILDRRGDVAVEVIK